MLDIKQAITQWLTSRPERASHGGLHVADVSNECPRYLWHRLKGTHKREYDGPTHCKFQQGLGIESFIRTALAEKFAAYGWHLMPESAVVWRGGDMVSAQGNTYIGTGAWYILSVEDAAKEPVSSLVGHPDMVFERAGERHVVEVKSTMWFRKGYAPIEAPSVADIRASNQNYILQGAAYAKAVGAGEFTIVVVDRSTGQFETYTFPTAEEFLPFAVRYTSIRKIQTSVQEPAPDLPPWTVSKSGLSYLCKTCPVIECTLNPAQKDMRVALGGPSDP